MYKIVGIRRVYGRSFRNCENLDSSYIQDLLHMASMSNCKPLLTPLPSKYPTDPELQLPFAQPELFRTLAGSLQYLTSTHPDIAFVLLKRILHYLQGTSYHALVLPKTDLALSAYSDSDWAGDQLDHKSTTGYCLFLCAALLS
ncbi:uncharacterized protein LOC114579157 [Dendrobium catenatum]|uniref:uncharacterized protein LOC114579157 n=1 Tax=Dendrobium catenatum TaxID=906689 RepID=UPI00109FCA01|nr:uncharacterized protein LOC114579157 [Dendrobium catenatum]